MSPCPPTPILTHVAWARPKEEVSAEGWPPHTLLLVLAFKQLSENSPPQERVGSRERPTIAGINLQFMGRLGLLAPLFLHSHSSGFTSCF